jgi:Cu(I)/Ag(I) efflux system membrane protein CusA/SilA
MDAEEAGPGSEHERSPISRLIRASVANRTLVLFLTVALLAAGAWRLGRTTVDAIPDLSDVQVIVRTEWPGQAPEVVEDQVTYPLTSALLAVPHARTVRGYSMFGASFVYVLFEDGTDDYWARSRVLEQLSTVAGRLPMGVSPALGPDATGVGWILEYVLTTGPYCPQHTAGLWRDEAAGDWYATREEAPEGARLERRRNLPGERCPLDGRALVPADVDLAQLRSLQDWFLRYELAALPGVSEIAPVGGFVKQYQVVVDPVMLQAFDLSLAQVTAAVRSSNLDVGGRVVELGEAELMVRGRGFLGSAAEGAEATAQVLEDLRQVALGATPDGSPVHLGDVAEVRAGPEIRRGVVDWNGVGETVAGIVVMRSGANARDTIAGVREKLLELESGLPPGVAIETAYDRSDLIERAVGTLRRTLLEEMAVVTAVIVLFLLHARSALVAAFVLPAGVLATLLVMQALGVNANIMSLGGIALSIGVMVDSAIVMVENAHKALEHERQRVANGAAPRSHGAVIAAAAVEVGPTLFFSLLIITVGFLPIFALGEQSGRLFRPLAITKTLAMLAGALLAVTAVPVLMVGLVREHVLPGPRADRGPWRFALPLLLVLPAPLLALVVPLPGLEGRRTLVAFSLALLVALLVLPQRLHAEERNPINRLLQRLYEPFFGWVMRHRGTSVVLALAALGSTLIPLRALGSEFMPPLEEGDLLYMPTTDPGLGMTKARELVQQTDRLIASFPEVASVLGKAGQAETATDPAPPSMLETTIVLHRDPARWRHVPVARFHDGWPAWLRAPLEWLWPTRRPITLEELVHGYTLGKIHVPGMNEVLALPGLTNAWTMPIKTRIDMLSTGIKTPVGIKVMGPDLAVLADLAARMAQVVATDPGTGPFTVSAFAEDVLGGSYLDVTIDREAIARHGLSLAEVQEVVMTALGGRNVTQTVEGLERYPVNVRYPHELRDDPEALGQTLVATPLGAHVPLAQLATIGIRRGPPMIKSENGRRTSWVYVDIAGLDVGTYVERARAAVARAVPLPPGTSVVWSGQFEYLEAARARLRVVVPLAGVAIVLLLYLATRSWLRVALVLLAVPFSLVGAVWLVHLLGYHVSLAVWVGAIALAGLDAETGLVMLLYLEHSVARRVAAGGMHSEQDLLAAVHEGAVQRIRPKTMTVVTTFAGLVPLLWAQGAGADTMRRLAAPMIGGLATSFVGELLLYPVLFFLLQRVALRRRFQGS